MEPVAAIELFVSQRAFNKFRPTGIGTNVESDLDFNGDRKQQFQEIKSKWEVYLPVYQCHHNWINTSEFSAYGSGAQISKVYECNSFCMTHLKTLSNCKNCQEQLELIFAMLFNIQCYLNIGRNQLHWHSSLFEIEKILLHDF